MFRTLMLMVQAVFPAGTLGWRCALADQSELRGQSSSRHEGDEGQSEARANFLWVGLQQWRAKLQSAEVLVVVRRNEFNPERGEVSLQERREITFDLSQGCYRFMDADRRDKQFCYHADQAVLYNGEGGIISITDPDKYKKSPVGSLRPFDICAAPLLLRSELDNRFCDFAAAVDFLSRENKLIECIQHEGGFRMVLSGGEMQRTLFFKVDDAPYVERLVFESFDHAQGVWKEGAVTETTWDRVEGVLVPVSVSARTRFGDEFRSTGIELDWLSINLPVADNLCKMDALDAPSGTLVVDDRAGIAIVNRVGIEKGEQVLARRPGRATRLWLMCVNIGLLCVLVAVFAVRKVRAARATR